MANQVTHTDVKILPRERACIAPPTSNPEITYAELRVHRKSERTSRSETSPSVWRRNGQSPSMLRTTCTENTTSSGESPCTGRCSMTISGLIDYLCEDREGRTECLLCPPGWMLHRGSCYYFSEQSGTWDASMRNCSGRKSQLLVVEDEAEMEFIATRTETKYFWIGLNFQEEEGRWMWLGDSQLEGHRLSSVVENGTGDGKNCSVFKKKKLYAESCPSLNRWICKKNAFTLAPWNTPEH
ncbi:killer cell lectin-like receptor subfamily B member 1C isoform X2 [Natator depressus]|uniref:killer cell lectin-like receptor subfamily B member 1C isoform X2 n=1 Tax=Natator depressus TaxID=27790 RepID=UPI003EB7DF22